ncbi:YbhN family protein [Actinoplanes sp. NPDC051343]|uniref:YbhN family protein n=1 Tax=Actinoplanes sp. NPDC051343 TaxID=3363906 RepID=UPI0037B33A84
MSASEGVADRSLTGRRHGARWAAVAAVVALIAVELVAGWPSLVSALSHLRTPEPGWLAAAMAAELAAMSAYARMQRRLLRSAGVRVPFHRSVALAYAAHSLSATLPGGPAFSTRFNFQQMRRFGASPAVAAWCIALSALLSAAGLAVVTTASAVAAHGVPDWRTLAGVAAGVLLLTAGIRYLCRDTRRIEPAVRAVLGRVNRMRRRPADDSLDRIRGFLAQLGAARLTPGHGTAAAAHAVLNWLLDAGCLWLCFHAVAGASTNPIQLLLAFCAGMAASTLTIVPGGLGIIDSALVLGLVAGGAATATAIATVVLYRVISFGFVIGAGWVAWLVLRRGLNPSEDGV